MAWKDSHFNRQTSGASVTVTAPSVSDGDILIAFGLAWKSGGAAAFTWPSGFAEWYSRDQSNSDYRIGLAWKRASSESGDYTISSTGAGELHAMVSTYSGRIATGDPKDVGSDTEYITNDVNVRGAEVTIATAGSDLLFVGFADYPAAHNPDGMNSRIFNESAPYAVLMWADLENQSTGLTGNKDAHLDDSNPYKHAFLVALKPTESVPSRSTSASVVLGEVVTEATIDASGDLFLLERKDSITNTWSEIEQRSWSEGEWTDTDTFTTGVTYSYRARRSLDGATSGYSNTEAVVYDAPTKASYYRTVYLYGD